MAEHQEPPQVSLLLQRSKGQQSPQGFTRTRPCENQNVAMGADPWFHPTSQQLDQLLLPEARSDLGGWAAGVRTSDRKGRGCDGALNGIRLFNEP